MYINKKNILKNNCNYIFKHTLKIKIGGTNIMEKLRSSTKSGKRCEDQDLCISNK